MWRTLRSAFHPGLSCHDVSGMYRVHTDQQLCHLQQSCILTAFHAAG